MNNMKGRPLKKGLHGTIPTTKFKRIEPLEKHELETHFDARMESFMR